MTTWEATMALKARRAYLTKRVTKGVGVLSLCLLFFVGGGVMYTQQQSQTLALYDFVEAQVEGAYTYAYNDFDDGDVLVWEF